MSLAKRLIKSPEKINSVLNTIPIPIYAWQIRRNNMFLIDYNSAAYKETKGEIKNDLGSIAAEYYKENIDLIDVLKECVDKSISISKEINYFSSISNEFKPLLIKTDFILPDLVLVQKISKTKQNLLEHKVKESEEIYRLNTEESNDLIRVLNKKFETEYVNDNILHRLLGYTKQEILSKNTIFLNHPSDNSRYLRKEKGGRKNSRK